MAAALTGIGLFLLSLRPAVLALQPRELGTQAAKALPVDILGAAQHDFAVANPRRLAVLRIAGEDVRTVWQTRFERDILLTSTMDLTGDGLDEICLSTSGASPAEALVVDRDGRPLLTLGTYRVGAVPVSLPRAAATPGASAKRIARETKPLTPGRLEVAAPFDRYGLRKAIVRMTSPDGAGSRGISLYDLETERLEWTFMMGSQPGEVAVADLDRDGRRDLVVASGGPGDEASRGGTDAEHSYVTALDGAGVRMWQVVLGGTLSEAHIAVLPASGSIAPELIATFCGHRARLPEPGRLLRLDAATGRVLARREYPAGIGTPRPCAEGEGFVAGSRDGVLRRFASDLKLVASRRFDEAVEAAACVDLDGDGEPEIVAATSHEVLVLDPALRVRARLSIGSPGASPPALHPAQDGPERTRFVLAGTDASIIDVAARAPIRDPLALAMVLAFGLVSGLAVRSWRTPRGWLQLPSGAGAREFLLDYHQILHETFGRERPFARLRLWAQAEAAGQPLPSEVVESACDEFPRIGLPTLLRFVDRARALRVDRSRVESVRELSQAVADALAAVRAAPRPARSECAGGVFALIGDLSQRCAEIYWEVAMRDLCAPDREVQEALLGKRATLDRHAVTASVHANAEARRPVLFDRAELRALIGELLENATRSLAGTPDAEVSVTVACHPTDPRWTIVRVADNGPGIPAGRREEVFAPENSSRSGGGFGLFHARETARRWLGDLAVEDSPTGRGAVLRLTLRVCGSGESRVADALREAVSR